MHLHWIGLNFLQANLHKSTTNMSFYKILCLLFGHYVFKLDTNNKNIFSASFCFFFFFNLNSYRIYLFSNQKGVAGLLLAFSKYISSLIGKKNSVPWWIYLNSHLVLFWDSSSWITTTYYVDLYYGRIGCLEICC